MKETIKLAVQTVVVFVLMVSLAFNHKQSNEIDKLNSLSIMMAGGDFVQYMGNAYVYDGSTTKETYCNLLNGNQWVVYRKGSEFKRIYYFWTDECQELADGNQQEWAREAEADDEALDPVMYNE